MHYRIMASSYVIIANRFMITESNLLSLIITSTVLITTCTG